MKTDREKLINWMQDALREWNDKPETGKSAIEYMADRLIKNGAVIPVRCKECVRSAGIPGNKDIVCGYFLSDGLNGEDYCKYGTTEEVKWDNDGWQAQMLNTFLGGKR